MKVSSRLAILVLILWGVTTCLAATALGQWRLDIVSVDGPSFVTVGQTFRVTVTLGYSLPSGTLVLVQIYEHGGPCLGEFQDKVGGNGSIRHVFDVTAPAWVARYRLNVHAWYKDAAGSYKESDPRLMPFYISVVLTSVTQPPSSSGSLSLLQAVIDFLRDFAKEFTISVLATAIGSIIAYRYGRARGMRSKSKGGSSDK